VLPEVTATGQRADTPTWSWYVQERMTAEEKTEWRRWNRERWEAVETFKARELAAMTDERARQIISQLRLFAPSPKDARNGMGLVEQQAAFYRGKR
jgi:hypothetical protein